MSDLISLHTKKHLPRVAIVGRPNVGKSTLFNRMIRRRRAITDAMPGVTRDPIGQEYDLEGHEILLVDTGGFTVEHKNFDELVTKKSLETIAGADAVMFLMDAREITGEDEYFIDFLRQYAGKILLVVNKIDEVTHENMVFDFFQYGFKRVVGISAAHGRNMELIDEQLLEMIDFSKERLDDPDTSPELNLSILGKPNTGKSTLTNYLTETENSIVSEIPGTTRDVISGEFSYKDTRFRVLDTAGIRRKGKVEEDVEYYSVNRAIRTIDDTDVVLLLVDITEGLVEQDKKIAQLIVKKGKGVVICLNKWDKVTDVKNNLEAITDRVRFLFPILSFAPIIPLSALKGSGVDKVLDTVLKVYKQLNTHVETPKLNKHIKQWQDYQEAPMHKSKRFRYKIKYATQTLSCPVQFLLFVNHVKGFPQSYLQYIQNQIRKDFDMQHIPLRIDIKEK